MKRAGWALLLLGLLLVLGDSSLALLIPWQLSRLSAEAQSGVHVRHARFNPYTWCLHLQGLELVQAGRLQVRVRQLRARLSPWGLLHRRLLLSDLDLDEPELWWYDAKTAARPAPRTAHWSWALQRLRISNLRCHLQISLRGRPLTLQVARLRLDDLDPERLERHLDLHLQGEERGRPTWTLHWQGQLALDAGYSQGRIDLRGLSLLELKRWLADSFPLQLRSGRLDRLTMDYRLDGFAPGAHLRIDELAAGIHDLSIHATLAGSSPALSLRQLQLEHLSLDNQARRLDIGRLQLLQPQLSVQRQRQGEIDLLRLLAILRGPPTPELPAWDVRLGQLSLRAGELHGRDAHDALSKELVLHDISLDMRQVDSQTSPLWPLQAQARGPLLGLVQIQGGINAQSFKLQIDSRAVQISNFEPLWTHKLALRVPQGRLDLQMSAAGLWQDPRTWLWQGQAEMRDMQVHSPQLQAQVQALQLRAQGHGRRLQVSRVHLQGLQGAQPNWSVQVQEGLAEHLLWQGRHWTVSSLRAQAIAARTGQLQVAAGDLRLHGLAGAGARQGLRLQRLDLRRSQLQLPHTQLLLQRAQLAQGRYRDGRWRIDHFELTRLAAQTAALQGGWQTLQGEALVLRAPELDLAAWRLQGAYGQARQAWLQGIDLDGPALHLDLGRRQLQLGPTTLHVRRGRLAFDRQGHLRLLAELRRAGLWPQGAGTATPAWQIHPQGALLRWDDLQVQLGDTAPQDIQAISAQLTPEGDVQLALRCAAGGQLQLAARLALQPWRLDGKLRVSDWNWLPWSAPWWQLGRRFHPRGGALSTQAQFSISARQLLYQGRAHLAPFQLQAEGEEALRWSALDVGALQLRYPGQSRFSAVVWQQPWARVVIEADRRLNWMRWLSPAPGASAAASTPLAFRVDDLHIEGGGVDFTDASLPQPFHVDLHDLHGDLRQVDSLQPETRSRFALQGGVQRQGRVSLSGSAQPFASRPALHLDMHLRQIEMPTLNPYAMVFAGYRIDQGLLDLDLDYRLQGADLVGKNHFRVDQLRLGPQVASNDMAWPLHAAIDVLRNRQGVIDLDVPIHGRLDDPEFDLRRLVLKASEGALRHVVEAPLGWVEALLGESPDRLSRMTFTAGSAGLQAADIALLDKLAGLLKEHPGLLLFIRGEYEEGTDGQDLRALALRRAEAVKDLLLQAGIDDARLFIDEPQAGARRVVLDLHRP